MRHSSGAVAYGKEEITFSVLFSGRKTLGIEVYPDSRVLVKAPLGTDPAHIVNRVSRRVRWIIRQQQYFQQFDPRTPARQFVGGETHLYLGKQFRLKVDSGERDCVKLTRGYLKVELKGAASPDRAKNLLGKWYEAKAAVWFAQNLEARWPYFERLGLVKPRLQLRRMQRRWGSLSKSGTLTLNTELIRAPKECIDYVITHELCHLQFHDHSTGFYQLLENMMPDWEKRKHKLELALV